MKIICFVDSLNTGGAQRQMAALAAELKRCGHIVAVTILHPFFSLKEELEESQIPVFLIERRTLWGRLMDFRKLIKSQNPDAVISYQDGPNFISDLVKLTSFRPSWKLLISERKGHSAQLSLRTKLRMSLHIAADAIVTNNERVKSQIIRQFPLFRNKVHVIYNMITAGYRIFPVPVNSKPVIHVIANYRKEKNVSLILNVAHALKERGCKFRINWYGHTFYINGQPTEQSKEYEEAVQKLETCGLGDYFQLHEYSTDIEQLFGAPDAILLASSFEGFPNVICEALICGRPVLASDVSDLSLWIENRRNGFIFDVNSVDSIVEAFEWMFSLTYEDKKAIAERNHELAESLFSKEKNCKAYLELVAK